MNSGAAVVILQVGVCNITHHAYACIVVSFLSLFGTVVAMLLLQMLLYGSYIMFYPYQISSGTSFGKGHVKTEKGS